MLDSQCQEIVNRAVLTAIAMRKGFEVAHPIRDRGVDLILYRDEHFLKVQLKSRLTVAKKYVGKNIWMAFPIGDDWYLMPHDTLVEMAKDEGWAFEAAWANGKEYSQGKPSKATIAACADYRFAV